MKRLRAIVLAHEDLVPPDSKEGLSEKEIQPWKTEYAVADTLRRMGHEVQVLGVSDDLQPIRRLVEGWQAQIVFNLLMEFQDIGAYQAHVASYLELLGVPFTGCNPLGILLTRDKALCKKILRYHRIPTARFGVFAVGRKVRVRRDLRYPLIVKSIDEEASLGISQKSVVSDEQRLRERVEFIHRQVGSDAIAEEYIEGRELTVSVLGNERLTVFPVWELFFKNLPEGSLPIATARAKWDLAYQKRVGIDTGPAKQLTPASEARIARIARRVYRMLGLSGYARLDLRLSPEGRIFVIEANATPDIADDEDFALSAKKGGLPYPKLLQRILNLGLSYRRSQKTDR
ncbi:MAG: ATP-grasp domain-containing protein [Deltaproteobacteria bacterium]|nr:ATP-grasp domain-containing protein [Deltaproteobacteria bacterium]